MTYLDLTVLYSVAVKDNQLVASAIGVATIVATTAAYYTLSSKDEKHEFPKLQGIQLYHAWNFFQRRYDFLQSNFERKLGSFSFNVLNNKVIALAGADARQAFFTKSHFNFSQGNKILMGAAPRLSNVETDAQEKEEVGIQLLNKRMNKLLSRARMQDVLPTLLQDIMGKVDQWASDGKTVRIDPFNVIYEIVFLIATRLSTCHELATNEADIQKIRELFTALQKNATPTALLIPWFPSPARKAGKKATTDLFTVLYTYVERSRRVEPTSDAIDVLIAEGETTQNIVGFIMVFLFASVRNTSNVSYWTLLDLAIHPQWKEKCKKEIQSMLSRHLGDLVSSATVYEKLAAIPVSAWEDELPILDACSRESLRIVFSGVALRRNLGEEVNINGQVVERGDFVAYGLADVHLNPEYYPEPYKYDPGRWLRPDPVQNRPYPFLGWGAGRHPCTGMKVAKLEMKLILAIFLTRYEYELVDENGKFPNPLPVPDRNDFHQARPLGTTCYFDVKKIAE